MAAAATEVVLPQAADFRASNTPIWRQPSFFGEFGDAYIQNSDLEGAPTEPSLVVMCDLIAKCCQQNRSELTLFSKEDLRTMRAVHGDLLGALDFARTCSSTDAGFVDAVDRMVVRLAEMEEGDRQVLLGGWNSKTKSAHAIVCMVECTGPDTFAWICCNTGQGVENYHPVSFKDYPERKFKTSIRFDGIERSRIVNPDVWYMILKQTAQASDSHTPETLYEVIIPHLLGNSAYVFSESDLPLSGHWERPQKAGTCYYRCLVCALRYLMQQYEFSVDQQRQLFVFIRVNYLKLVQEHLRNDEYVRLLTESDVYLINLACSETGIMADRMCTRLEKVLPDANRYAATKKFLDFISDCQDEVKRLLPTLESRALSVIDSSTANKISASDATTEFVPFSRFELIFDESVREQKRGYRASGSVPVYLDLLCPFVKPEGLEDHAAIFAWCLTKCDAIRSRSNVTSMTTVLHQLSSFVDHVFLDILECPAEFHYGAADSKQSSSFSDEESGEENTESPKPPIDNEVNSIWRFNGDLSADSQRSSLAALLNISHHYISAVRSLPNDSTSRTVSSFTMGVIYVFADAIIRIKTTGKSDNGNENSIIATLLQRSFGASMINCSIFDDASIFEMLNGCVISRPEIARARHHLLSYHMKLAEREAKLKLLNIFKYRTMSDRFFYFCFTAEAEMANFIRSLRAVIDPNFLLEPELPPGGRKIETGEKFSDTELLYSWFVSDWTKTCPEFAHFRDMNVLFQLMLNPNAIFSYKDEARVWTPSDARLTYYYSSGTRDKTSVYYLLQLCGNNFIYPSQIAEDAALNISELVGSSPLTETRLLNLPTLPNFDNALTPQEAEQLFSYLIFPHLAIPLVLNFFSGDRIGLLLNKPIQDIVQSVLLQPGKYTPKSSVESANAISEVPVKDERLLATSLGVLMEECLYNSTQLLVPMRELCENALALCVGGYQSSVATMLLFLVRQAVRILAMCIDCGVYSEALIELRDYLAVEVGKQVNAWAITAANDNDIAASTSLYCHSALICAAAVDARILPTGELNCKEEMEITEQCVGTFLSSASYVVSWNSKATNSSAVDEKVCPIAEVFYCLQKLKEKISNWSKRNLESMNKILDNVVSVSLQHPFSECGGWQQSNREPMVCSLLVENETHPYPPCSDWSQTVSFPGAASINVYFDARSCTEANADYVLISYPGCNYKFEGPAHSNWPGAHGSPPLVIPCDTFVVEFHSDGSIQDWGFAFTAIAPISALGTEILVAETGLSTLACQVALRKNHNFLDASRSMIQNHRDEILQMEALELERRAKQRDNETSPGLFQDSIDYVQVNIQSTEVFISNRVSIPVPSDFASHHDFSAVFKGLDVPSCTILGDHTNRFSIQVLCPEEKHGCYEIDAWRPLQPYGVTGSGRGAVIRDQDESGADNGRCTAFNLPVAAPTIVFCDIKFNNYIKGSCGWLSELFDKCNLLGSELEGVWCSEGATSLPSLSATVPDCSEIDAYLLIKAQCSNDGQDLVKVIGHPGAWFEVHAPKGQRSIFVYALVDHGRRTQRQIVFSTEGKNVLQTLSCDPFERTAPVDPLFKNAVGNMMGGFKDWKGELVSRPGVGSRQQERIGTLVVRRTRVPMVGKEDPSVTLTHSGVFCAGEGLISSERLVEMENLSLEEYLPENIISGLIPEALTESYQFWRTGSRVIRGYNYKNEVARNSLTSRSLDEDSLLVVLDPAGHSATVHRMVNGRRRFTLMDASRAAKDSFLFKIANCISAVECLSHVLFWTKSDFEHSDGMQECEVSRIELTRLRTSLDIRHNATDRSVDFVLSDHDDLALQFAIPLEISRKWGKTADFLAFANSSGQYYLFLPNFGFSTPSVLLCPFQSNVLFDRTCKWFENVDTRFYLYPVHAAFSYLEYPDLSASLYWMLLSFVRHEYTTCADMIGTVCRSDLKLSYEQRWILSLIPKTEAQPSTANYSHPDANACRLLLTLLCIDCGENPESEEFLKQFWDPKKDYQAYLLKISYVSQNCRLSTEQERVFLDFFDAANRKDYLDAQDRLVHNGQNSFEVVASRLYTKDCKPFQPIDLLPILDAKEPTANPRQLRRRRRENSEKVCYERPDFSSAADMMASLNSVWSSFEFATQRTWSSEFAHGGFLLLYEILTGVVSLKFKTSLPLPDNASFWITPSDKPKVQRSENDSTGQTDISNQRAMKSPADYSEAAESLFAMDLIPDVTVEQIAGLLCIYNGNQELVMEEYFADSEAVMAKLAEAPSDASGEGPSRAQAEALLQSSVLESLTLEEIEQLLKQHKGNAESAVSSYFEDPEAVSANVRYTLAASKTDQTADEKSTPIASPMSPTAFPVSWQFAKLVVTCLCDQFDSLKMRKEMCILLALVKDVERRVDEIAKTGSHSCIHFPPLFPYAENMAALRSLEGMDSTVYQQFLKEAGEYAMKVVYELQQTLDDDMEKDPPALRHKDFVGPFVAHATPDPFRPEISNYSCEKRDLDITLLNMVPGFDFQYSTTDIDAFASCPLKVLNSFKDIVRIDRTESVSEMPFDLSSHSSATKNPPAVAMLNRIRSDLHSCVGSTEYSLSFFAGIDTSSTVADVKALLSTGCVKKIESVVAELQQLMIHDTKCVLNGINALESVMNTNSADDNDVEWTRFRFNVDAQRRCRILFEYYVASLASTNQVKDLQYVNPFLGESTIESINSTVLALLMQFVRARQASICIQRAHVLLKTIRQLMESVSLEECTSEQCADSLYVLRHELAELVSELRKKRHYVRRENGVVSMDPRFIIFEYLTGFLLRKRQVELIEDFMSAHRNGKSSVHQMIMGAGKTQVIAPLLSLMLADGKSLVTVVCPNSLLQQSRTQFRNRFSNVLQKNIVTLKFERASSEFNTVSGLKKLYQKLVLARKQRAVVLTNPQSIKSLMLKYIDLLLQLRKIPSNLRVLTKGSYTGTLDIASATALLGDSISPFEAASKMADVLGMILKLWSSEERGIALLDEVDLILHPLKSELNFPIGNSESLSLMPERFELPMYLLELFLSHGEASKVIPHTIVYIWNDISAKIDHGRRNMMFQSVPHLALLNEEYYFSDLAVGISRWAVTWLRQQPTVKSDLAVVEEASFELFAEADEHFTQYICKSGPARKQGAEFVTRHCSEKTIQLLNLSRDWVLVYLPHVISKIHRVSYGLIDEEDVQRWVNQEIEAAGGDQAAGFNVVVSKSRRLLAVPFDGKDAPSRTSEFANPEIQIGLSISAYRLHGMRKRDTKDFIAHMKRSFSSQPGPFRGRPARIQFEEWKAQCVVDSNHDSSVRSTIKEILPLELLQSSDALQLNVVQCSLGSHSNVISYYMSQLVFPLALEQKSHKIQANGVDLGSDMIFGARFGFSGTPSDLLPRELQPCHFEKGCEAEVFRVLSSPFTVSVPAVLQVGKDWTVDDLLDRVANGGYSALIDTGALITGYRAEEVARRILKLQKSELRDKKEVCVFLNEHDVKMAVTLDGGPAVELDRCGAKLDKRFVFYDHVHTTGIDIKHSLNAIAVCTLGKDMTLRDYAQGCWRMRGLGKGQRIHVLLIEEVSTLIRNTRDSDSLLDNMLAWLLTNSFKSEKGQFMQLQTQSLANIWRRSAYEFLRQETEYFAVCRDVEEEDTCKIEIQSRFQNPLSRSEYESLVSTNQFPAHCFSGTNTDGVELEAAPTDDSNREGGFTDDEFNKVLQDGIDLFLEPTSTDISTICTLDQSSSALQTLDAQLNRVRYFTQQASDGEQSAESIMSILKTMLSPAVDRDAGSGEKDYNDREIVQEQEKEKDEEREREVFQVVHPEDDGEHEENSSWDINGLFDYSKQTSSLVFYPLKDLVVNDSAVPSSLDFPGELLVSQAHAPFFHTNTGNRRLKNVTCVLAWRADLAGNTDKVITSGTDQENSDCSVNEEAKTIDLANNALNGEQKVKKAESFFTFLGIAKKWRNKSKNPPNTQASSEMLSCSDVELSLNENECSENSEAFMEKYQGFHICLLSLAEAQTLQFAINRRPELKQIVSLHCIDSSQIGVPLTEPIASCFSGNVLQSNYHKKFDALLQCAAFFNNNLYFAYNSLILLLDSLGATTTAANREIIFKETMKGRLRDQNNYYGSPINWLFKYENKKELLKLRGYCNTFQKCLERHFTSFTTAFEHFSMGKYRQLTASLLCSGLVKLSENILSEPEAEAMIHYIWNSRQRGELEAGLGLLDFEMLYPTSDIVAVDEIMSSLTIAEDELELPNIAPRMMRQKSSQQAPINEFYSRIHIPSIPSIGKWIIIDGDSSQTCRARLTMSTDCKLSAQGLDDGVSTVTISPRAVTFKPEDNCTWCFELTVFKPGELSLGFASSTHPHVVNTNSRKMLSLSSAVSGAVIRAVVDMSNGAISCWQRNPFDDNDNISEVRLASSYELDFSGGIYPYITMNSTVLVQLNDGSIPFSSYFGSMPTGCHSLSHWIRREQEKNYVCYRHSLGTFGRISFMSGGQELEVVKRSDWSPHGTNVPPSPSKKSSAIKEESHESTNESQVWELMPPKDRYKTAKLTKYESSFPTIFLDGVLLTQGQWYYEVTCGCKNVAVQLGWSDLDSLQSNDSGLGVGDDKHSWAIDGDRRCLWHNGSIAYGKEWKIGDVCGIACNLDVNHRSISFCLNGEWFKPVAFPNIDFSVGLTPALTVQGVQPGDKKALSYIANFGPHFKHPPGGQYRPVSDYIRWGREQYIEPSRPLISSQISEKELDNDLGPNINDFPVISTSLGRLKSAQPTVVPSSELCWVPLAVRSGHGQVAIDDPVFANGPAMAVISRGDTIQGPCVRKTVISTTGHDDMSYPSVSGDRLALRSGKWCYEVDIVKITPTAQCSIGFAETTWSDANWATNKGVGSDSSSWGVFFKRDFNVLSCHNGTLRDSPLCEYPVNTDESTSVSVCIGIDCDNGIMLVSVNNGPAVTVFEEVNMSALVPAISLQARGIATKKKPRRDAEMPDQTKLEVNFGETPFKNTWFVAEGFAPILTQIKPIAVDSIAT